jgi:peptide/nickel transport system substrate-binding protein
MVVALVLASCGPAVTEEEEEEVVTEEEEEVAEEEEEEEAEGPEMVRDSLGRLVEKPKYGGVLVQAFSSGPQTFDNTLRHIGVAYTLHITNETLLKGDWAKGPTGTGEASWLYTMMPSPDTITGSLAESWDIPDEQTLIFHIRQGVHWHDKPPTNGREMTADDVLFTLRRLMQTPTSVYFNDDTKYFESFDSITAPDKWTVVMKVLPGQIGPVYERYVSFMRMMPPEAVAQYGDLGDWRNAVGTGPFMLVDYVVQSSVTFERNPNYWMKDPLHPDNQLPYLDGVKWLIIPDASTRIAAMRTAKVDHLQLDWENAEEVMRTTPELEYEKHPAGYVSALNWRVDNPELPWYDVRVRQALAMAVDQQEIADTLYGGQADLLAWPAGPIMEHLDIYTPIEELPEAAREHFEYLPDKAKQLLAEAGYPDGFKAAVLTTSGYVDLLSVVKAYWADIGVDLELEVKETGAYYSLLYGRNYEMVAAALGSTYPYSFYFSVPLQAWNYSEIDDPVLNDAYKAITENYVDDALRRDVMKETIPYELGQSYRLLFPGAYAYTFWWPWVKGYSGELLVGFFHITDFQMYLWIDQDLKEEITGRR